MHRFLSVAVLAVLILCGERSFADSFTGTTSAIFGAPIPAAGNVHTGAGTNSITLGTGVGGSGPNSLTLAAETFDAPVSTDFAVAGLTYYNGQTTGTTSPVTLPVDLTIYFTNPAGLTKLFSFSFELVVTPNSHTPLSNPLNDDTLTVPTAYAAQSFSNDGTNYYLKLDGFSDDNGNAIVSTFDLPEESTATSTLYAQITGIAPASTVPSPKSVLGGLVILGLLGTLSQVRRLKTIS